MVDTDMQCTQRCHPNSVRCGRNTHYVVGLVRMVLDMQTRIFTLELRTDCCRDNRGSTWQLQTNAVGKALPCMQHMVGTTCDDAFITNLAEGQPEMRDAYHDRRI